MKKSSDRIPAPTAEQLKTLTLREILDIIAPKPRPGEIRLSEPLADNPLDFLLQLQRHINACQIILDSLHYISQPNFDTYEFRNHKLIKDFFRSKYGINPTNNMKTYVQHIPWVKNEIKSAQKMKEVVYEDIWRNYIQE